MSDLYSLNRGAGAVDADSARVQVREYKRSEFYHCSQPSRRLPPREEIPDPDHCVHNTTSLANMKILNRLPISRADTFAFVGTEGVRLKKDETIVWVSLSTVSAARPLFLEFPGGVAVFPDGEAYPRLPLFGLRAILSNNLPLRVDGEHASVTLRTPDWRTRLLSWLA